MGPCCLIDEEEIAAAIKWLNIGKAAGLLVSEMMKASSGFGTSCMTYLISNIVNESCFPCILLPVYKGKVTHFGVVHKEIQRMKYLTECWKIGK